MVKEAVRDLDAAKLAECSGRLAPGWLVSAKDRSANKAKNSQRQRAGSSRSWRSECLRRPRPSGRVRQRRLPWRGSVEQAKQRFQRQVLRWLRDSPHPTPSLQGCTAWPQSRLLSRKEIPRAVGWTSAAGSKRAIWPGDKRRREGESGYEPPRLTVRDFMTWAERTVFLVQELNLVGDARREAESCISRADGHFLKVRER